MVRLDDLARLDRRRQSAAVGGTHADHTGLRRELFDHRPHARDQPAPAHRDKDSVDPFDLVKQFQRGGALARDHLGVVVG